MTVQPEEIRTLVHRLEKLERSNGFLRRVMFVLLVLLGGVVLMGQSPQKNIIEAEKFVVRNATGSIVLELGIDKGKPHLSIKRNRAVATLGIGEDDAPFLTLRHESGIILQADDAAGLYLSTFDTDLQQKIASLVVTEKDATLLLEDKAWSSK